MKTIVSRFERVAIINIIIVFALSAIILTGWLFYDSPVKNLFPGNQLSNPVTSICFLLACISLICLINSRKQFRTIGKTLASVVLLIGLVKFSEVLFNYSTGIDKWLFTNKLALNSNAGRPNFMAPNTAMSFFILGVSLLLFRYKINKKNLLSDYFASAVGLISLASLIGYAYQSMEFYQAKKYIPMALPTALSFFLVSSAILLRRSEFGFFSLFTTKYEGSKTARFLVPFAVLIPITTGLLRLYGESIGLYSSGMGVALFAITNIILFLFVIWRSVLSINTSSQALEAEMEERKKAEQILFDNQQLLKDLYDNAPCGYHSTNSDGVIVNANNTICKWLGYTNHELINKKTIDIIAPENKDDFKYLFPLLKKTGKLNDVELSFTRKDGSTFPVLVNVTAVKDKNGNFLFSRSTTYDITERKNLENVLKNKNEIFLHLFYSSPLALIIRNIEDGKIIDVNEEYERLLGYKKEELIGQTSMGMGMILDPEFSDRIRNSASDKKSLKNIEATLYNSKKEPISVIVSIESIRLGNTDCIISALLDITGRKKIEEELQIVNKELESFTYSVSHDLRAPLRIINGYAEIMKGDTNGSLSAEPKRMLENIIINARRMENLIEDLLNFSRLGRRTPVTHNTDMNDLVQPIIQQYLNGNTKYNVQVNNLPPCYCDSNLVKQVWENLISNAVKYSANNPAPEIEIGSREEENNTVYYIKDNGAGFDMKYYDKLFGVFQRLHKASEFEGTGVGLALSQRIISKHGGKIWAESKINEGSTFYFTVCKSK